MTENTALPSYMTDNRGINRTSIQTDPASPNTFKVSEEEAARLRAMAMNNNGSALTPEMQAAMGMINGDYNQKIPDKVHNYICYDEARKNNEKYRDEASAFTNAIVQDNATREILDEAEATTNLSKFDFGNIDEYLIKLEDLSFLEAVSYKKKIDTEIARWKSCKSMLKAISDLKLDDTTNRELMKINAMADYNFTESIEDFESHYEENLEKLNKISIKLVEMVNSHKHEMDSTKFLTNEMIHLMHVKFDKLNSNELNYNYTKNKIKTVIEAFQHRLDLSYLRYKLEIYLKTNKNNIRRDFRDNMKIINSGKRSKVINDLIRYFNEDIVYAMYDRLMSAFSDDTNATYIMMGFIAKIMNTEKKSSKDAYAKVFVLNLSDIYNDIFDIDIENYKYMENVESSFYPIIKRFLDSQKMKEKIDNGINFSLKTPTKKKKNASTTDLTAVPIAPAEEATVF